MNIAIVGLGLIGGSLARSIKAKTSHSVFAVDTDQETMTLARLCGAVDAPLSQENLSHCDLVMTAIRPAATIKWVEDNGADIAPTAILVDMCGVKRQVCAPLSDLARRHGFSYIGGHPMAGKERGGFVNSTGDLFDGASMILTPDEATDMKMLVSLKAFFTDIGFAGLTFTDPDSHDKMIAYTSQLAHVVSSAYIKAPEAQNRRGFSAGSYRDMTRVALLDEDMWTELFLCNADYLSCQLELLMEHLAEYQLALKSRDADALRALLRDGREKKATAGGN